MDRRYAGAGLMRRDGRSPQNQTLSSGDPDDVLNGIGVDLLYWMEPRTALVTLSGSKITDITALAGTDWAQGTDANRPTWSETGGPNSTATIVLGSGTLYIEAVLSTSVGARLGFYVIAKRGGANSQWFSATRVTVPTTVVVMQVGADQTLVGPLSRFTGGLDAPAVTSPALDTGYHLHSSESFAAGNQYQIDNVGITAQFVQTTGFVAADGVLRVGATANAGGEVCGVIVVNDPLTHSATVDAYVSSRWGL